MIQNETVQQATHPCAINSAFISGSTFEDIANAGIFMGTCINENAVKLIMVGIDLITAFHEIVLGCISVKMSNKSALKTDPLELRRGKK